MEAAGVFAACFALALIPIAAVLWLHRDEPEYVPEDSWFSPVEPCPEDPRHALPPDRPSPPPRVEPQ